MDVRVPKLAGSRSVYLKAMDRAAFTFALASAAVRLDISNGRITNARIVVGGVAPVPWREKAVEEVLIGQAPSESLAARAAEYGLAHAQPLSPPGNAYKIRLARGLVKRAILSLL